MGFARAKLGFAHRTASLIANGAVQDEARWRRMSGG